MLWSHHEETRELPEERDSARNNVRCMQARKTTHGVDGQHHRISQPAGAACSYPHQFCCLVSRGTVDVSSLPKTVTHHLGS